MKGQAAELLLYLARFFRVVLSLWVTTLLTPTTDLCQMVPDWYLYESEKGKDFELVDETVKKCLALPALVSAVGSTNIVYRLDRWTVLEPIRLAERSEGHRCRPLLEHSHRSCLLPVIPV